MSKATLTTALESISHQKSSQFFNSISVVFKELLDSSVSKTSIVRPFVKRLEKITFEYTGLSINLHVVNDRIPNGGITIPHIDKNHPLIQECFRHITNNSDSDNLLKDGNGIIRGMVDRDKSKVGGAFSKLKVDVTLTTGLFSPILAFTSGEVSAIFLHELGHIFTYFEYLGTNITTNYILQNASRALLGKREVVQKYKVVDNVEKSLSIKIDDKEALFKSTKESTVHLTMLREVLTKRHAELDSTTHDMTGWEMLADQFASRHGCGRDAVTSLDKMYRMGASSEYYGSGIFLLIEAAKLVEGLFIKIPYVLSTQGVTSVLAMLTSDPNERLYDKPRSRIIRIRRDMVSRLKVKGLDKEEKKSLLTSVTVIDNILDKMVERRDLLEYLWSTIIPKSKKDYKQLQFQQDIETLITSDLYVKAAKIETLST